MYCPIDLLRLLSKTCNVFSDTQDGSKEPYNSNIKFFDFLFMKYIKSCLLFSILLCQIYTVHN